MMCTTGLHGGVCHRTSTPHKSGIKMKKKKKKIIISYAVRVVVPPESVLLTFQARTFRQCFVQNGSGRRYAGRSNEEKGKATSNAWW